MSAQRGLGYEVTPASKHGGEDQAGSRRSQSLEPERPETTPHRFLSPPAVVSDSGLRCPVGK